MKKILIISSCSKRGTSIGLIGSFLSNFKDLDKTEFEINLFDTNFIEEDHKPSDYPVEHYYNLPNGILEKIIKKIPRIRAWYAKLLGWKVFKDIVYSLLPDIVILYQIPIYAERIVLFAHANNIKVIFVPWGSEVLRLKREKLMQAFNETDCVVGAENSNVMLAAENIYCVPKEKIRSYKIYLSGVKIISEEKGKKDRKQMSDEIGIPLSNYNIICAYNGYITQRHELMIEAISSNKYCLPSHYQLIFPITYGASESYIEKLKDLCLSKQLNAVFLTAYMSDIQIAYLHLITDLYINIQPTDTGNAFMIESLFCGNQIITGRWLNYVQFEQYGEPYYLIDSPDDLGMMLNRIFTKQVPPKQVPDELKQKYVIPENFDSGMFWKKLFYSL